MLEVFGIFGDIRRESLNSRYDSTQSNSNFFLIPLKEWVLGTNCRKKKSRKRKAEKELEGRWKMEGGKKREKNIEKIRELKRRTKRCVNDERAKANTTRNRSGRRASYMHEI